MGILHSSRRRDQVHSTVILSTNSLIRTVRLDWREKKIWSKIYVLVIKYSKSVIMTRIYILRGSSYRINLYIYFSITYRCTVVVTTTDGVYEKFLYFGYDNRAPDIRALIYIFCVVKPHFRETPWNEISFRFDSNRKNANILV